jgi:peptide/nickel transport system permease protein
MIRYIARRLLQSALLLFLVVTAVFFMFQVMPGDITVIFIQPNIPAEARQEMISRLGLDRPAHERFGAYVADLARGDMGTAFPTPTFQGGRQVRDIIAERLPRTALLFSVVVMASYLIGFVLGKRIAWHRGRWTEYAGTVLGVVLLNVFTPVAGLFFLWLLALRFPLFPFGGWQDFSVWQPLIDRGLTSNDVFLPMLATGGFAILWSLILLRATREIDRGAARSTARFAGVLLYGVGVVVWWRQTGMSALAVDVLQHMALPVLTLVTIGFAAPMLIMRDSMLETMREDFILTARAKGLEDRVVRDRHAARTALLPIATSFALAVALVVDGALITETIFSWPGMGHALLRSVIEQNFPVTMGMVLVLAVSVLLAHLVVDLLYAWMDPRIRYA